MSRCTAPHDTGIKGQAEMKDGALEKSRSVPRDEAPNEPADPKQRKPRAEHHAELLMGLANQSKQSSVDAAEPVGLRRMLGIDEVLRIVPVSAVTLWRMERNGLFPKGTFISPNKKIWWADEVVRWQQEVDGRRRGRRHHPARSKS
jgi:predicted DNA-binding transcriptional regulator AlpA